MFKGAISQDFRPFVFLPNRTTGPPDSGDYSGFVFVEMFNYENNQLSILLSCHGVRKIIYNCFVDCCFNGFKKAEALVYWLRGMLQSEFATICKNYLTPLISDPSGIDWWKSEVKKSCEIVQLNSWRIFKNGNSLTTYLIFFRNCPKHSWVLRVCHHIVK
jgi:hypothetical protein